ncbi:MAG: isoaspartyl peptidase/L-asparaginase [Pyrinomonadaceae bacterium]
MNKIALAIHGGAGTIRPSEMSAELETQYRNALSYALKTGWEILNKNGSSLDAVEAAVVTLEDFPLFNAGRGSVFTNAEKNEMDAAIMNGATLEAGAVAFIRNVKNPVKLARLVMERTEHILLAGGGAVELARELGVEFAPDEYFFTDFRHRQLLSARAAGKTQLDHAGKNQKEELQKQTNPKSEIQNLKSKIGTVGAVACDRRGNLAAATSTGGMTNKKFGRVGDTPIIGAGTYADNRTCAVSCTGHGEFFIKGVTAYDVSARMKYKGLSLEKAAAEAIEQLSEIGGEGGLIAVDALGNITLPFNSEGMYRGFVSEEDLTVEIYRS